MLPTEVTKKKENKPVVPIDPKSRDIKPHVSHLVLSRLKNISEQWWAEVALLLSSKNSLDRKFAITEINKIQLKAMPNQISAEEGVAINVNVINYGDTDTNPIQLYPTAIPGTIIEGDGLGDDKSS